MNPLPPANGSVFTSRNWHSDQCYGCGTESPHGLHAEFPFDEATGELRMTYQPLAWQRGAPGKLHGGVLAALLDEAQGMLCHHLGHMVMTDQLELKYHKATALDAPLTIRAWITAARKRRLYTRAELHSGGELRVHSRGVWYILPDRIFDRMFGAQMTAAERELLFATLESNRKRAQQIRRRLRNSAKT